MGTGAEPKIAIALTIAIFAMVIDTVLGLKSLDPDLLALARTAHASELQILLKLRFPGALPSIFSGLKIAISLALVGTIVGEFVAGSTGLGQVILQAQGMFQAARVFAAVILLGIMGTILFYSIEWMEKVLVPWHVSQRVTVANHRA
jgi:NitT/TauT family transport system permease protein